MRGMGLSELLRKDRLALTVFASVSAFMVYSCMYAFRKPFAAAEFGWANGVGGLSFKAVLVLSQLVGYTLSKFIGIKLIAELRASQRVVALITAILLAEVALIGFGMAPTGSKWLFMLLNGLPLGLIWGIVFSYVEGRRSTEVIGAVLCTSFIFASGMTKSVGKWLLNEGISESWMPAATGALFLVPFLLSVAMLAQVPPPLADDVRERTLRVPMNRTERRRFFISLAWGLVPLIVLYTLLTAFRDMRDNFMAEVLHELGHGSSAMAFTATEVPVAIVVLGCLSLIMFIKDNRTALAVNMAAIAGGCLLVALSSALFAYGMIGPMWWVPLIGTGAYLAYVPFNCILFERVMALQRKPGNAGFLIYVADSFGYLASMAVLLWRDLMAFDTEWVTLFVKGSMVLGAMAILLIPFAYTRLSK